MNSLDKRMQLIISQIQEILITRMIYGTDKYDNIILKDFRDIINKKTQSVLDKIHTIPIDDAISTVLEE